MLSILYSREFIRICLGEGSYEIYICDLKETFENIGSFLENIINIELVEKLELLIDYLDRLDDNIGINLSAFIGCKELVIHSRKKNTGINFNALPLRLERLILKYDILGDDMPIIELNNLPININYLILGGIIVDNLHYLPYGLIDMNFYEVYLNNDVYFDLPPNVKNFLCTYTARNFKVGKQIKNVSHNSGTIKIKKEYLEGGIIKKF
jgi:hypothetical protein